MSMHLHHVSVEHKKSADETTRRQQYINRFASTRRNEIRKVRSGRLLLYASVIITERRPHVKPYFLFFY